MTDYGFDAVIFDLDGVITTTALVHSAAWKKMFDVYLKEREVRYGEPFRPFSHEQDYLPYVDGKPRYKGVQDFLASRGIRIPYGNPEDSVDKETVCALGNRKNEAFNEVLRTEGVEVFPSTVALMEQLKVRGIRVGVASSSKNCRAVLERAGLQHLIDTRVDGEVSVVRNLKGKPEPDIFTAACDDLGVTYDRAVVVEDAVSGVQAGRKGNFGLVLGIAREHNEQELERNGADIVVNDIGAIGFEGIAGWFENGLVNDGWMLSYDDYVPAAERTRETLLTTGNGYMATRGAMEEALPGQMNYPGTYMAAVYNRLTSKVAGRDIENEDFVNGINWHFMTFRIDDGEWFDINKTVVVNIHRSLDFRNGLLTRQMVVRDERGRETRLTSQRMISMAMPHLAAVRYSVTPLNYAAEIDVMSGLYGDHINGGVDRYKELNQQHLKPEAAGGDGNRQHLAVTTTQSGIRLAAAAKITVRKDGHEVMPGCRHHHSPGRSEMVVGEVMATGSTLTVDKITALYKSTDHSHNDPLTNARDALQSCPDFEQLISASARRWSDLWGDMDIKLEGDRFAQKMLRLHIYHTLVTASPHNAWIDAGIPARGLHGEAYRGHIFWDELFILPFYFVHLPAAARSVLMYRYRRLEAARTYAKENGFEGAMFPWQSGSSGREETQVIHLNPVSGRWDTDYSSLQRHVSLAIAYNTWYYYYITGDKEFMKEAGLELFFDISRFWASKCQFNPETGRYSIDRVMGPDEFHEKYRDATKGGLKDNAYTNLMVVWMFKKAEELWKEFGVTSLRRILDKMGLDEEEMKKWSHMAHHLNIVISEDAIIAQYDGYFNLKELEWDAYRQKYGNISRLDRILKAEGKSPDEFKVAKQADTLMTFYNLDKEEVDEILKDLNYHLPGDYLMRNLNYYLERTSHGSTLSRVVHAHLANILGDKKLSWSLYADALGSDYGDIQGGTTAEGIHAGVMTATVWLAIASYAGVNLRTEVVRINPCLPDHWRSIEFRFKFRGDAYHCIVSHREVKIEVSGSDRDIIDIIVEGKLRKIVPGKWNEIKKTPHPPTHSPK